MRWMSQLVVLIGVLSTVGAGQSLPADGDEPLKVGGDGVGLLASPDAYKTRPMGTANVFGGRRPDLFVNASRGVTAALYLYRWVADNESGQPIFAPPVRVKHPLGNAAPDDGSILQLPDGTIVGHWFDKGHIARFQFDRDAMAFKEAARLAIKGLPRSPSSVVVASADASAIRFVVSCGNGAKTKPAGAQHEDDYVLYDGTGAFRGEWPYVGLWAFDVKSDLSAVIAPPKQVSLSAEEIRGGVSLTPISYASAGKSGVIAGANLGNLYFFAVGEQGTLAAKRALFGAGGHSIRHPTIGATPVAYPDANGRAVDLLVGGEGALFHYRFTGKFNADGHPIYGDAEPVWQQQAEVFAGTLPVPTAVDWDGDGAADLIVGNSEGRVLFFKNRGTDLAPQFGVGEPLTANGDVIHEQPGYYGIQGPFETRWGYTCPNVVDWNGDGLPDLLLSGATMKHEVFLNVGSRTQPKLAAARPLYHDGLELHGVWRVRPGVARMDGRMAYVIQDDENALRIFWRIDDYNVEDGGRLKLTDGRIITSHITGKDTGPGQSGRGKIEIVDWDRDGKLDLLVGCAKRGSFPEPDTGLPWARRRETPSLQVVFFRNVGTNAAPTYEYPRQLQFRGKDTYHGAHANSPAACTFGHIEGGRPNLLIGMECGRLFFYAHDDITFVDAPSRASPERGPETGRAGQ